MTKRQGKFWACVAVIAGFPLTLAGLSAGLGYLAVPFVAPSRDALSWALGVMAATFLGLVCGPLALYHGMSSIRNRPSGPMRWPAIHFFGIAFALTVGMGLVVVSFEVAEQFLFPPLFLLGAALPPLSAVAWATRRLGWPITWRQGALALAAGSTLSVIVAIVLEVGLGVVSYLLMAPLQYGLILPGSDFVSRLFFSPALALFLIATAVQAPIPEEFAKALSSTLFGRQRIASERQALALGMVAGAGFAILENMMYEGLYATQAGWGWGCVTLLRGLGAALHPIGAALVTVGWYRAREKGWGELLKAYAVAVGLHTLWNGGFSAFVYVTGIDYYSQNAAVSLYGRPIQVTLVAFLAALSLFIWWLLRRLVMGVATGIEPDLSPVVVSRRSVAAWACACTLVAVPLGASLGPAYAPIYGVVLAGLPTPTPTPIPTPTRTASPSRTPTPARTATPTGTSVPSSSRTPEPQQSTPRPSEIPLAQATATAVVQLRAATDTFYSNVNDCPIGTGSSGGLDLARSLVAGKYRWETRSAAGGLATASSRLATGADFALSVDGRRISGEEDASYGLVFRYVDDDNFYVLRITNDAYNVFQVQQKSQLWTVGAWVTSRAIQPGEVNRLGVVAIGRHFVFSINGTNVREADDDRFSIGRPAWPLVFSEPARPLLSSPTWSFGHRREPAKRRPAQSRLGSARTGALEIVCLLKI